MLGLKGNYIKAFSITRRYRFCPIFGKTTLDKIRYYGDNNETPTMPATCLADHDVLAIPAGRHLARKHTPCYWRQLSLDTPGEVKRTCPPSTRGYRSGRGRSCHGWLLTPRLSNAMLTAVVRARCHRAPLSRLRAHPRPTDRRHPPWVPAQRTRSGSIMRPGAPGPRQVFL